MCSCQALNRNPKGPQDSEVDNSKSDKKRNRCTQAYALISGPDGPLTRRYAPAASKPLPGPLRPRTEIFSSLTGRMASQGRRGPGTSGRPNRLTPGFGGLAMCHMQQQSAAFHAAGVAFVGSNIRKVMYAYIRDNDEIFLVGLITSAARIRRGGLLLPILLHMEATVLG